MRGVTPLIRLLASDFVDRYHIGYDQALDSLFRSRLMRRIEDSSMTFCTWAPGDLLDWYEKEELGQGRQGG